MYLLLNSFTDYALEFPNRDVNDYVQIWGMPNLTEFTVCFWMKSNDSNSGKPFSYAIPEENNELLIINYSNLEVWIAGHATGYVLLLIQRETRWLTVRAFYSALSTSHRFSHQVSHCISP